MVQVGLEDLSKSLTSHFIEVNSLLNENQVKKMPGENISTLILSPLCPMLSYVSI